MVGTQTAASHITPFRWRPSDARAARCSSAPGGAGPSTFRRPTTWRCILIVFSRGCLLPRRGESQSVHIAPQAIPVALRRAGASNMEGCLFADPAALAAVRTALAAQLGAAFGQAQEAHAPAHSRAIARQKVAPVLHQRLRCCRNAAIVGYGVASKSTSPIVQSRCGAPTPLMRVRGRRSWLCFSCGLHLAKGASASGGPACLGWHDNQPPASPWSAGRACVRVLRHRASGSGDCYVFQCLVRAALWTWLPVLDGATPSPSPDPLGES